MGDANREPNWRVADRDYRLLCALLDRRMSRGRGARTVVSAHSPEERTAGVQRAGEQALHALRLAPRRAMALLHIAAHPDASNREVAAAIGIDDDAQTSRLLARMQDLGLILNQAQQENRGGPNAWQLTTDGSELVRALRRSTRS
jgi:DNA-binding MarR family transcriptional regulator